MAAEAIGAKFFFTGKPCTRGHVCARLAVNGGCVECRKFNRTRTTQRRAELQRKWRAKNAEHRVAYQSSYYSNNKEKWRIYDSNRRCKETADELSPNIVDRLLKLQRGRCACCSKPLGDDFHLDHVLPLSRGGRNIDSNMQLLRKLCNLEKHAKHPADFMRERGFLI